MEEARDALLKAIYDEDAVDKVEYIPDCKHYPMQKTNTL